MKKDIVRKTYLKKRQELSSSKFEEESSQLVQNTIELIKKYKPECIHCFLPIHSKGEINTTPIIQYCWKNNINVVVPVSNFEDGTLKIGETKIFFLVEILIQARINKLIIAEIPSRMNRRIHGLPTCTRFSVMWATFWDAIRFFIKINKGL